MTGQEAERAQAVRLIPVTEDNWMEIASLDVKEHQKSYVAPAVGLLARGAEAAAFQLAGYKIHIQPYSRRTAVDNSTYGGSVGLAVGGYSELVAVGVHRAYLGFISNSSTSNTSVEPGGMEPACCSP